VCRQDIQDVTLSIEHCWFTRTSNTSGGSLVTVVSCCAPLTGTDSLRLIEDAIAAHKKK
jgi:hypothetical protein